MSPKISRQSAHEGAKVVSPMHRPSLPTGDTPGTHFCKGPSRSPDHSAAGRINLLVTDFFFQSLAHPVFKM